MPMSFKVNTENVNVHFKLFGKNDCYAIVPKLSYSLILGLVPFVIWIDIDNITP